MQLARKYADVALLCEEWWEITHENNLNYLDRLFKDDATRRSLRMTIILQVISVTLCYALTSEKSANLDRSQDFLPTFSSANLTLLKNLLFYTHQNFLVIVEVIISRLPSESTQNIWAHSLQAILLNKSSK